MKEDEQTSAEYWARKGWSHARADKRRKKERPKEREKQRGREGGGKSPQRDQESSGQGHPVWGVRQSREKNIPDTQRRLGDPGPAGPGWGHAQGRWGSPGRLPRAARGPAVIKLWGSLLASPKPAQIVGVGGDPEGTTHCLRRRFSEPRPQPHPAVAEDSGLGS